MKINEILLQSFAMAELDTYDLSGLSIDKKKAQEEIKNDLLEELEDLNAESTKKARLDYFKVKNAKEDDYDERLLILQDDKKIIYGIRNMGGNPKIPFVQLRANFEISSKEESLRIYDLIKSEFKVFDPLYLSFQTQDKIDADFYGSIHMLAPTSELIQREKWPQERLITFESITDTSYYDWYQEGYAQFHQDFPKLKTKVTTNSLDSMEDSLEQGLLKFVNLNGQRIGLIAGERSNFLNHSGIYFHEIYISKKWKGQGFAKAIQRKFIEEFCKDLEFVWGTIDCNNLPSYKTALSNERKPVRYECFVNLK